MGKSRPRSAATYVMCKVKNQKCLPSPRGRWGVHPDPFDEEQLGVVPRPEPVTLGAPGALSPLSSVAPPASSCVTPSRGSQPGAERPVKNTPSPPRRAHPSPARSLGEASATTGQASHTANKLTLAELQQLLQTEIDDVDPSVSRGLSSDEARRRLTRNGPNIISTPLQVPESQRFLLQFCKPFMVLMMMAGVLSFIAYGLDTDVPSSLWCGIVLFSVVLIQCTLSHVHEHRSNNVMVSLRRLMPKACCAIRDGQPCGVRADELVVGDVVLLKAGDRVPADVRIIQTNGLKVDCSAFTGEPASLEMCVEVTGEAPHESRNLAPCTGLCTEGSAYGVVLHTGDQTLIGRMAAVAAGPPEAATTLQLEVRRATFVLSALALVLALVVVIVGRSNRLPAALLLNLIATVLVAAVPQGLPATVMACLHIAAKRMLRKRILVKNLEVLEMLGSATCIASDKTGTLTQNSMSVQNFWFNGAFELLDGHILVGCDPASSTTAEPCHSDVTRWRRNPLEPLLLAATVCNSVCFSRKGGKGDGSKRSGPPSPGSAPQQSKKGLLVPLEDLRVYPPSSPWHAPPRRHLAGFLDLPSETRAARVVAPSVSQDTVLGDPLECGLFRFCDSVFPSDEIRRLYPKVLEQPYRSSCGFGAAVVAPPAKECPGMLYAFIGGDPEEIAHRCSRWLCCGEAKEADGEFRKQFLMAHGRFTQAGERVIAFAMKLVAAESDLSSDAIALEGFTFLGLISLMDPPRQGVDQAVLDCHRAGIRVFMITGDHERTAEAVARKANIITEATRLDVARKRQVTVDEVDIEDPEIHAEVVSGLDLKHYTGDCWDRLLQRRQIVFARISPEQKLEIVEQLQRKGEVVAVTGDGVNDAPALKRADIGVAMGFHTGSDVAREAADIVIMDDDFCSLIDAIREGRLLFQNLRKSATYTFTHLLPEIVPVFLVCILQFPLALSPLLILTIDLGSELLPAMSLAYEQPEAAIMEQKPRDLRRDRLVTWQVVLHSFFVAGVLQSGVTLLAYLAMFRYHDIDLRNVLWSAGKYWSEGAPVFVSRGHAFVDSEQVTVASLCSSAYYANLVLSQMFHLWFVRARAASVVHHPICSNKWVWMAMVWEVAFILICCYIKQLQPAFVSGLGLPVAFWLVSLLFMAGIGIHTELLKYCVRRHLSTGRPNVGSLLAW